MELRTYLPNKTVKFITIVINTGLSILITSCHKNNTQKQTTQVSSDPVITNLYLKKFDSKITDCYSLDLQNFAFTVNSVNNSGIVLGNISSSSANKCSLDSEYMWQNNNLSTTNFPLSQIPDYSVLKAVISSSLTDNNTHAEQILMNLIINPAVEFRKAYLVNDHLQHIDNITQITAMSTNGKYFSAKPIFTLDYFSWVYIDSKIVPLQYEGVDEGDIVSTTIDNISNNGIASGSLLYKNESSDILQKLMICDFNNKKCKSLPNNWNNQTQIIQALISTNGHIYGTIIDENDEFQVFDYDIAQLSSKIILSGYSITQNIVTNHGLIVVTDSENTSYIYDTNNNKLYGVAQIAKMAHLLNANDQLLSGSNIFLSSNEQYVVLDTNINPENLLAIKIFFPNSIKSMFDISQ